MSFKTQPKQLRPRERLVKFGAQTLSTADLISIVLNTGIKTVSVDVLSKHIAQLLERYAPEEMTLPMLQKVRGVGFSKACTLLSIFELIQRFQQTAEVALTSPETVASHLHELRVSHKEILVCLYLNARFVLEHKEVLAIGTINHAMIVPRDIFLPIKQFPVAYLILAHNHPSGSVEASDDDILFTQRVAECAKLLGLELIDHIVLSKTGVYSMKQHGEMG